MRRPLLLCLFALGLLSAALYRLATIPIAAGADNAPLRIDVTLVTVPVVVTDRNGRLLHGLQREDFLLKDQGIPQEIRNLWHDVDLPLTVGLIVDISSSQMGLLTSHREVVAQFLNQVIGPQDQAFLVTVNDQARLLVDLTRSTDELQHGLAQIETKPMPGAPFGDPCRGRAEKSHNPESCIGTPIWDSVFHTARTKLRREPGRKALIVLTDGIDSSGSVHGLQDAIEAAQAAGTPVYAIRYRSSAYLALNPVIALTLPFDHGLDHLAVDTGGTLFPNPKGRIADIFSQIEAELRSQYVLAYTPNPRGDDGRFHKVEIHTRSKDQIVRAPKGYRTSTTVH